MDGPRISVSVSDIIYQHDSYDVACCCCSYMTCRYVTIPFCVKAVMHSCMKENPKVGNVPSFFVCVFCWSVGVCTTARGLRSPLFLRITVSLLIAWAKHIFFLYVTNASTRNLFIGFCQVRSMNTCTTRPVCSSALVLHAASSFCSFATHVGLREWPGVCSFQMNV